jgi:PKD repeat protein
MKKQFFCLLTSLILLCLSSEVTAQRIQLVSSHDTLCTFSNPSGIVQVNFWAFYGGTTGPHGVEWTMPDGSTLLNTNRASYNFRQNAPGVYNTTACLTDSASQTVVCDSATIIVDLYCPTLTVSLSQPLDSVCPGKVTDLFTDIRNKSLRCAYLWNFGDGTTSTAPPNNGTISHQYVQPGIYTTSLCVIDSLRQDRVCDSVDIIVRQSCPPLTGQIEGPDTLCLPFQSPARFTADVQYSVGNIAYFWQNGQQTSTLDTFNAVFNSPGVYNLSLRIIDHHTAETLNLSKQVVVLPWEDCNPDLAIEVRGKDSTCLSESRKLSLNIHTPGNATAYRYFWQIGKGSLFRGTDSLRLQRTMPDSVVLYGIVLDTITNEWGVDSVLLRWYQNSSCPAPVPDMHPDTGTLCITYPIGFVDSTSVLFEGLGPYKTLWEFGDGNSQMQYAPYNSPVFHQYALADTYALRCCIVDTLNADTACAQKSIIVEDRCWPIAVIDSISVSHDSACVDEWVYFDSWYNKHASWSTKVVHTWNMGDGNFFDFDGLRYMYQRPGDYTVEFCLLDTVYFNSVCIQKQIHIKANCSDTIRGYIYADIDGDGTYGPGDQPLEGVSVGVYPYGYRSSWYFSDANGWYECVIPFGYTRVWGFEIPGFDQMSPTNPTNHQFHLKGDGEVFQADFAYSAPDSTYKDLSAQYRRRTGYTWKRAMAHGAG